MSDIDFLKHANTAVKNQMASVLELPAFLETADRLSLEELKTITRQALALLELTYVHLPFKRAMHAVDPIQRLKLLLYRLENTPENQLPDEIEFHHEMTEIFTSLRDLHTNYLLPAPYNNKTAFLPFYIEEYFEAGKPKYIVSKVMEGFRHPTFKPGVEVRYWNGIPIARAIWLNGQRQAGGNQEARYARGLDSLTVRPMNRVLPPDEEWVCVEYRSPDGKDHEIKHKWLVFSPGSGRAAINPNSITAEATALGLDIQTDAVQEAKKVLFAPGSIAAEKEVDRTGKKQAVAGDEIETIMPGVFRARTINAGELSFGYVRIFTFNVNNADQFVCEFIRLIGQLPENGLIIDVRGNGGGLIYAGEQLLQVLTPHHIEPESFQFINTTLTYQLCQAHSPSQTLGGFDLTPWTRSTGMAVETGSTYSQGYPVTDPTVCNAVGQKYYGPVVLITNALCYSTTDIFAAGFQDLDIGKIIATSGNTGAGGANVWTSGLLQMLLNDVGSPFKPLPGGADMRVAIRRSLRVGKNAGTPVEDLGVVPDYRHYMTKNDLLNGNADLIAKAAEILSVMPVYRLSVNVKSRTGEMLSFEIFSKNIERLDVFLNGRPQKSVDVKEELTQIRLDISFNHLSVLEIQGFREEHLVASTKIDLGENPH